MIKDELTLFAKQAIASYTPKSQKEMAEEECAEFIVAMRHHFRGRDDSFGDVQEEIADVIIMMSQMRQLFGPHEIDNIIHRKVARELKRINDPSYSPDRKRNGSK